MMNGEKVEPGKHCYKDFFQTDDKIPGFREINGFLG